MKLLITGDLHLRADKPRCRLDEDWEITQTSALREIVKYANANDTDLCIVGDVFHTPVVPPWVTIMFLRYILKVKKHVYIMAGNHDLPYHSWKNVNNSTFGIIWSILSVGKIRAMSDLGTAANFGEDLEIGDGGNPNLLFLHTLVFPSAKDMPPNTDAKTAPELLAEYPGYEWIFTGDYHQGFHYEKNGRHVVNPGCILRQAADLKDYQPGVLFVDTDEAICERLIIHDTEEMVTDVYLKSDKERKDRIEAFVESVRVSGPVSLDFKTNLQKGMKELEPDVVDMIETLLEEAK
jgi:exonuclease SbcD